MNATMLQRLLDQDLDRASFVVRASVAPMHAEARVSSAQTSQALRGFVVRVLERRDEWFHVRGEDGYEGWVHRGYLAPHDEPTDDPRHWRLSLGAVVACADESQLALPLGARVAPGERIVLGEALDPDGRSRRFAAEPTAIVASARRFFVNTPYQWGGVTPWGADCSGLVQRIFALHGVPLPRDAWQQAEVGTPLAEDPSALPAAALLFFSDRDDRRVTHVGIADGAGAMLHLALGRGGWAEDRLDDEADAYRVALRARFLHARRVVS